MTDERVQYICKHCGARDAYLHETKVTAERPARVRFRCRSCRKSWSSHEDEPWFGLRAGGRHREGLSAFQLFFRTIANRFLRVGLPDAIRDAREATCVSAPTASRWIKELTGARYRALRPVLGPEHELLRECLGVYRGRFKPPRTVAPEITTSRLVTSPIQAVLSVLTSESREVLRSLLRARTVAALVAGIRSDDLLANEGIGAGEDGPEWVAWRRDPRVGGALFIPSWLDDAARGRDLGGSFWPKSALRAGIASLHDIGSIVSWRTPPEWWRSDKAKTWLFDLSRLHWQTELGVSVGGETDPDLFDWLTQHPPPPPIDIDVLEEVLREELSDLEWWLDATDNEPDFDARRGWSYWVVGKLRVVRFVVATPRRVIGYASMRVPRALPARFALRLMPEKREIQDVGEGAHLELPFDGGEGLSMRLVLLERERRVRGWGFPYRGKA